MAEEGSSHEVEVGDERRQDDIYMEAATGLAREFRAIHSDQSATQAEFANHYSSHFETHLVLYLVIIGPM